MDGSTIIEVGQTEKRIYTYPIVSSNAAVYPTYELTSTLNDAEVVSVETSKKNKKNQFKELSVQEAHNYLLVNFDDNLTWRNTLKLRSEFPYYGGTEHHSPWRYQHKDIPFTNESIEIQRERIRLICDYEYDSLVTLNEQLTEQMNNFKSNYNSPSVEQLSATLSMFPELNNGGMHYRQAILDQVIEQNPETYFAYMETITEKRTPYYWQLDKAHLKLIKHSKTKSPIKGEIRSFKIGNHFANAGIITLSAAVNAAFIGGIVYLIRLL